MAVSTDAHINLFGLSRSALEDYAKEAGQPAFRGRQLFRWLYGKGARTFDEMTDLPQSFREYLAQHASIDALELDDIQFSSDRTHLVFPMETDHIQKMLVFIAANSMNEQPMHEKLDTDTDVAAA